MGEPTETVVLEGGPYGDPDTVFPYQGPRLHFGRRAEVEAILRGRGLAHLIGPAGCEKMLDVPVVYRDTGRRTADGRRVFAPEGGV